MLACSEGAPPKTLGRQVSLDGGVIGSFKGGNTRVDLGLQMAVKVDDGDGPVFSVDGTEKGEGDGVVASEGD